MFKDLQRLFRDSVAAFRAELGRREPEDRVAELLGAMRREMVAARAALPALREEVRRGTEELRRERALLEQCERRGAQAERIGDAETVRVAEEFAARHRERAGVLEQKLRAAEAEYALRSREAEEMVARYRDADANRFALVAQLRRASAGERLRSALDDEGGPWSDLARMEEAVADSPPPGPAPDVEERLRELKRRMANE
jgi:phage shock protein A